MAEAALAGEPRDRPATIWAPSADFNRVLDGIRDGPKLTSIFFGSLYSQPQECPTLPS